MDDLKVAATVLVIVAGALGLLFVAIWVGCELNRHYKEPAPKCVQVCAPIEKVAE